MKTIARKLHHEIHVAWIHLAGLGFAAFLGYEFGRHVLYFVGSVIFGLAGGDHNHWGKPPSESGILGAEIFLGWLSAYLMAAAVLAHYWVNNGFAMVAQAQEVPTSGALLFAAGQGIAKTAWRLLYPIALAVLLLDVAWYTVLMVAGILGARGAIEKWLSRQASGADVIDINARPTLRFRPRSRPGPIA